MLAWQLAFSQLVLRRLLSLLPWRSTSRTRSPSLTASPTTLSSPRSIVPCSFLLSLWRTLHLFWVSISLRHAMLPHFRPLAVCHRSGASAFSICGLPRLQFSVPFLFGLPPLPARVLCSPCGGSCRRVHDLFFSSVICFFLQSSLLPSTHSLRMLGSVSPRLRRPLPFLHTGLTLLWRPPLNTSTSPSISTRPLRILHSILSVSLMTCHILFSFSPSVVPTAVDLLISNPWMTVGWNGLPSTHLPKVLPLIGFVNGSVALAGRPLPCRTSLLCPQSRVLSVPLLLPSSLTGPLDALCASVFLVNSLSLMTVSAPHLSPLFHQRQNSRLTGSRTVLCRGSHHSTVGDVVTPLLPVLALSLGSSVL